jgi:membrane associated rhomboid family serine protease
MAKSRRSQLFVLAAALFALVPVVFGLIRAISTGDDVRYLWLALSAILGSMAVMGLGQRASDSLRVSPRRAVAAVAAGATCAAATAILLGATAGPGVAIVAVAFGLCTGASAVLISLARRRRVQ